MKNQNAKTEKVTHTPGPWKAKLSKASTIHYARYDIGKTTGSGNIFVVANASNSNTGISMKEAEANAQLIAAAPELLEALQGLVKWTEATAMYHLKDSELLPKGFEKWKQVINKATGE